MKNTSPNKIFYNLPSPEGAIFIVRRDKVSLQNFCDPIVDKSIRPCPATNVQSDKKNEKRRKNEVDSYFRFWEELGLPWVRQAQSKT